MVLAQDLRDSVLKAAIQGKLTKQLSTDSNVNDYLHHIKYTKEKLIKNNKIKKGKIKFANEETNLIDIPQNWEWKLLDDIFVVTKLAGFEYSKYFSKDNVKKEYEIPIVRAQNIRMNKFIENTEEAISLKLSQLLDRSSLTKPCILMTFIGAGIGDVCIYNESKRHHLAPNVAKIEPFVNDINLKYFLIYLTSFMGQRCINLIKKETAQPSLSMETIRGISIPIPPIEEQQRIVNRVNELMKKIDDYEKVEKELLALEQKFPDDMKNALLQAAMQGKLTEQLDSDSSVDEMLDAIKEEKKQLIKDKKIKKEKPLPPIDEDDISFEIPDNWRWKRLGDLVVLLSGQDLSSDKYFEENIGIPYLTGASNFQNGDLIINRYTNKATSIAHKGDLLITCKGTIGEMAFLNLEKAHIARQIMAVSALGNVNLNYIKVCFSNLIWKLKTNAKSIIPGIDRKTVLNLSIPLPPVEEQQRIVERLEQLLPLCETV